MEGGQFLHFKKRVFKAPCGRCSMRASPGSFPIGCTSLVCEEAIMTTICDERGSTQFINI